MQSLRSRAHSRLLPVIGLTLALLVLFAPPARADMGVPMLFIVYPASWVLLLLIIPLEAVVARRILKFDWRKSLRMAAAANLVSTLAGIPVTWLLLVLIEMFAGGGAYGLNTTGQKVLAVTLQSPWLIPYEHDFDWMIPAAVMTLCLPFFLMSVWCEYRVARRCVEVSQRQQLRRWAWNANALSYGLIWLFLGVQLFMALWRRGIL